MEESIDDFRMWATAGNPSILDERLPYPLLYREVLVGADTRKLSAREVEEQAARFRRMLGGRSAGYLLAQHGAMSVEGFLKDVIVPNEMRLEPRIVRLAGDAWPVHVGSAADVNVPGLPAQAFAVEPSGPEWWLVFESGECVYGGEKRAPGTRVLLEEGQSLQIGREHSFLTFTPSGLAHYLRFQDALRAAKAPA